MRKIVIILVLIVFLFSINGCIKVEDNEDYQLSRSKLIECVSNELTKKMTSDGEEMDNIPLTSLFDKKPEEITYYEGKANGDNRFMIIDSTPYTSEVMDVFSNYFSSKYEEYYMYNSDFYVYYKNKDDNIDIDEIMDSCKSNNDAELIVEKVPQASIKKLSDTDKIIINSGKNSIGNIKSKDSIKKVIDAISNSKASVGINTAFLCDGHGFEFEMYDGKKNLDTIYVWRDGRRLMLESLDSGGCKNFLIDDRELDLKKIIEDETDYIFYNVLSFETSSQEEEKKRVVAEDDKYKYYFVAKKDEKFYIHLTINHKVMELQYALDNGYIDSNNLSNGIFEMKEKK